MDITQTLRARARALSESERQYQEDIAYCTSLMTAAKERHKDRCEKALLEYEQAKDKIVK